MLDIKKAPFFADIAKAPPDGQVIWRYASDGARIRVAVWSGGKRGTVFILTGRSEYIEKYGPTIEKLLRGGYSAVICDWRGQGLSERLDDDESLGHVESFGDYQLDLKEMFDVAQEMDLPRPNYFLAHSMGGSIALRALHQGVAVSKVIFSAPFWDIHVSAGLKAYATLVSAFAPTIGLGARRAPTTSSNAYIAWAPYEGNFLTSDAQNYAWMQEHVSKHPELVVGGPSLSWLREALYEIRYFQKVDAPLPECLCFLGSEEKIVSPKAVHRVMSNWPNGELVVLQGAEHEILMEAPEILKAVWARIFDFLKS